MDDTAVMLHSLSYWPHLRRALDLYCAASTAHFNEAKTEILPFNHPAEEIPADLPVLPTAPDTPVRYLGAMVGNQLSTTTRKVLREDLISSTLAAGHKSVLCHTTLEGRAYALQTFIYPRLVFAFTFEDFTMEQVQRCDRLLHRTFWGKIHGFLRPTLAKYKVSEGGYGLPTLNAIYRATMLKMVARLNGYLHILATSRRSPLDSRIPEWPHLLLCDWRECVRKRVHSRMPRGLDRVANANLAAVLWNPIAQTEDFGNLPSQALPYVWRNALRNANDKRGHFTIRSNQDALRGDPLSAPLLATGSIVIKKATQWKLLGNALALLTEAQEFRPAFSVADIPAIIATFSSPNIQRPTAATRGELATILQARYDADTATARLLVGDSRHRPYYYNWDYSETVGRERALPYTKWLTLRETRDFIEHDDQKLVFPRFQVINRALDPFTQGRNQPSWRSIQRLNAPPPPRSTLHRLLLGRLPLRHNNNENCHCGQRETIQHLVGECRFFADLRRQFLATWVWLAHRVAPTIHAELPEGPYRPTLAALREALPRHSPRLTDWLALPFLRWRAYADLDAPTATAFTKCYELAAALMIHLHWVSRNDFAYSGI
ncbi:hypothetical protein H4R20_006065, partial [Coemansia guatemalensis]